jgi:SAM-dependent methyltransferase
MLPAASPIVTRFCEWPVSCYAFVDMHGVDVQHSALNNPRDCIPVKQFQCNVCGRHSSAAAELIRSRETPSCVHCGSNLRFRTLIHGLSVALFDAAVPLSEFPVRRDLRGIGLSDADLYAKPLSEKLDYTNTFFHTAPMLDIANMSAAKYFGLDFVIASDVFEHVAPPIDVAFKNARRLLRKGGVLIVSVPYVPAGRTVEHFPDLYDYAIESNGDHHVLLNRTRSGVLQRFENLVFHGGPGTTLEMRLFSFEDLQRHFLAAGFEEPKILREHVPQFGIDWEGEHCSIPMIARARWTGHMAFAEFFDPVIHAIRSWVRVIRSRSRYPP